MAAAVASALTGASRTGLSRLAARTIGTSNTATISRHAHRKTPLRGLFPDLSKENMLIMRNRGWRDVPGMPTKISYPDPVRNTLTIREVNIKDLLGKPVDDVICLTLTGKKTEEIPPEAEEIKHLVLSAMILDETTKEVIEECVKSAQKLTHEKPDILSLTNAVLSILESSGRTFHPEKDGITEKFLEATISSIGKYAAIILHIGAMISGTNPRLTSPQDPKSFEDAFFHILNPKAPISESQRELLGLVMMVQVSNGVNHGAGTAAYHSISFGGEPHKSATERLNTPKHGFANIQCARMIDAMEKEVKSGKSYDEALATLKLKGYPGFGHAIYKVDPRCTLMLSFLEEMAEQKQFTQAQIERFNHYKNVRDAVQRKKPGLNENVDFWTPFLHECIGVPEELYTAVFAMSLVGVGTTAQWIEMFHHQLLTMIRPQEDYQPPK
jgi:citrate synthase